MELILNAITGMKSSWNNGGKVWASKNFKIRIPQTKAEFFKSLREPIFEAHIWRPMWRPLWGEMNLDPKQFNLTRFNPAHPTRFNLTSKDPHFGSGLHPQVWPLLNPCGRFDQSPIKTA